MIRSSNAIPWSASFKGRLTVGTVVFDRQAHWKDRIRMAKCGYNRTTALPIRGGPKRIGGTRFYIFQNTIDVSREKHFLKNCRTPWEDIGKALRIAMIWTKYKAVVSYPIFANTSQDLLYVKGRTILSERKNLGECQAKLHLDTTHIQHPLCKKDVAIMDLVDTQTTNKIKMNQKEKINCVRIFLGVQYLSQISTVD